MCGPALGIIGFAVSALGSVAQFAGQQQQADAQNERWKQNYTNALAAARDDQQSITLRQEQEQDAYGQKVHESQLDVAGRQAETVVAAAQGGVSGISVDNLLADVARRGDTNQLTATKNFEMTSQQLQAQKDATNTTAINRINSVPKGTDPSPLALVTNIASAGVNSFAKMG